MFDNSPTTNPKIATVNKQEVDTIRLYVPYSRRRLAERSIAMCKARLLAGGWSIRQITGGWVSPIGKVITEPVDEHEFLVNQDKAQAVRQYLIALSEELLAAGEQAVLLVALQSRGPTITYTLS